MKAVVTRRHRGVGGKDHLAGNLMSSSVEAETFFVHAIANRFEHGETTVALVEVKDSGRNAHGSEGAKAAYAEQQFLANAGAAVAAVKARGQVQILGCVAGN